MGCLDERTKQDFLVYANSVIKSRAIPKVEDNFKPKSLPSPNKASNLGVSVGVEIIKISLIPASISVDNG